MEIIENFSVINIFGHPVVLTATLYSKHFKGIVNKGVIESLKTIMLRLLKYTPLKRQCQGWIPCAIFLLKHVPLIFYLHSK